MKESVLTKRIGGSPVKQVGQMEIIPFYEENMDMEMMEVLRTMQSPMDERRRVQERVLSKHRYDSQRQYWAEQGAFENNEEHRFLRKTVSMNDLQNYSIRNRRPSKSYVQIHQEQREAAGRNDSINSRSNSSQDNYLSRHYSREMNGSRLSMTYNGSQPSSRLSMAPMPPMDSMTSWRENSGGGVGNRFEPDRYVRSENSMYPHHGSNSRTQFHPHENVYNNRNFSRAPERNSSRSEVQEPRRMCIPLPGIGSSQGNERVLVTMSPSRPDQVSVSMIPVPNTSRNEKPLPSHRNNLANQNVATANKVQSNSFNKTNNSVANDYSRQEKSSSLKNASPPVNHDSQNTSSAPVKSEKNQHNVSSRTEKVVKRSNSKSETVVTPPKSGKSNSSRKNQPDWYNRVEPDGSVSSKEPEKEKKGSSKPSTGNGKKGTTDGSVMISNTSQKDTGVPNISKQKQKDRQKVTSKETIKQKKPRQSSLRKTNSFKVFGRSTNFFGFYSVADMKAKKKVTFSNDESERPGTA